MDSSSTDTAVLYAVGAVGVLGTLLGAVTGDQLARVRERRATRARQRRAVTAVVGELLDAASIVDKAAERNAWWSPGDAPRDRSWVEYSDDLAELLPEPTWHQIRMTYETVRSFGAMRDDPVTDFKQDEPLLARRDWDAHWVDARDAANDAWTAIWDAIDVLKEFHLTLARPGDLSPKAHTPPAPGA